MRGWDLVGAMVYLAYIEQYECRCSQWSSGGCGCAEHVASMVGEVMDVLGRTDGDYCRMNGIG